MSKHCGTKEIMKIIEKAYVEHVVRKSRELWSLAVDMRNKNGVGGFIIDYENLIDDQLIKDPDNWYVDDKFTPYNLMFKYATESYDPDESFVLFITYVNKKIDLNYNTLRRNDSFGSIFHFPQIVWKGAQDLILPSVET